jgi:hypothetical protein
MKQLQTLIVGLLITITGFTQTVIKFKIFPSKIATKTELIIPFGERYLYEKYMYFKFVYFLEKQDTLTVLNDSILTGKNMTINQKNYNQQVDFCDSTINYIRNSSLLFRQSTMINDSCRKYIGNDNKEFDEFRRQNTISENVISLTCSDAFPQIASIEFIKLNEKILEIFSHKKERTDWVRTNPDSLSIDFIDKFISDFNYNRPDRETFIELCISRPTELISCIDKLEEPYLTLWNIKELPKTDRLTKAIQILENGNFKGQTYRKILRKMNKNKD